MARIAIPLLAAVLCLMAIDVLDAKKINQSNKPNREQQQQPIKKYDPTSLKSTSGTSSTSTLSLGDLKSSSSSSKSGRRSPRQTNLNEQRQYYPCMTCFRLGSREVCTNPYCPSEDFQCDKPTKRCHKKARVGANRVTPETAPEQPPAEEN